MATTTRARTNGTAAKANEGKADITSPPVPPQEALEILPIRRTHIRVPINGTAPLIISKFSAKARQAMLDAQQNRRPQRETRDPEKEFFAAQYRFEDGGYGLPTTAFKECTVGAARYYKGVTMKDTRQMMWIRGEWSNVESQSLVRILPQNVWETDPPTDKDDQILPFPRMREDVVRLAGASRSADLRFRPEFLLWRAVLDVIFVPNSIAQGSVINMIEAGGMGVGVGEWRPERRGDFGTFEIDTTTNIQVVDSTG